jgi:hypothetical protein
MPKLTAASIVILVVGHVAMAEAPIGISIQPLQEGEKLPLGESGTCFFITRPKGSKCEWFNAPQAITYAADASGQILIRVCGNLHRLNKVSYSTGGELNGRKLATVEVWSDKDVQIEMKYQTIDTDNGQTYSCFEGHLTVQFKGTSKLFQLWGVSGCV